VFSEDFTALMEEKASCLFPNGVDTYPDYGDCEGAFTKAGKLSFLATDKTCEKVEAELEPERMQMLALEQDIEEMKHKEGNSKYDQVAFQEEYNGKKKTLADFVIKLSEFKNMGCTY